jgi:hypothetical protein
MKKTSPSLGKTGHAVVCFLMLPFLSGAGAMLIYMTPEWISFNGYCFICLSILIVEAVCNNQYRWLAEIVESIPHRDFLSPPLDDEQGPEHPVPDASLDIKKTTLASEISVQRWNSDFSINIDDCTHGKLISLK